MFTARKIQILPAFQTLNVFWFVNNWLEIAVNNWPMTNVLSTRAIVFCSCGVAFGLPSFIVEQTCANRQSKNGSWKLFILIIHLYLNGKSIKSDDFLLTSNFQKIHLLCLPSPIFPKLFHFYRWVRSYYPHRMFRKAPWYTCNHRLELPQRN